MDTSDCTDLLLPDGTPRELHSRIIELQQTCARLEHDLRICEERYRTAFEYTGTAMMVVEEDTTVSMWNNRLEEVTGYTREYAMAGRKWTDFVAPQDLDRLMQYHIQRRHDSASVPNQYEFRMRHRSGELRDILMSVSIIPGTRKSLISLIDITERKRMEESARESERKFRDLFETASDIVFMTDFDGRFTSANPAALRTYGYSAEEMHGINFRDIVDPESLPLVEERLLEKKVGHESLRLYEVLTHTRGGESVWVEISTRIRTEHGVAVGIQGIARNITDRKRAEQELFESRERFKAIADHMPGVICELDHNQRLTYVNDKGLALFGYSPQELTAGITAADVIHPEELQRAFSDITRVASGGPYGTPREYKMRSKDGTVIHVLINSSPLYRNDQIVGTRHYLVDITQQKLAQEQVLRSEEKFRGIFSRSPVGIGLFDTSGDALEINESFRKMFQAEAGVDPTAKMHLQSCAGIAATDLGDLLEGKTTELHRESWIDESICAGLQGRRRCLEWRITTLVTGDPKLLVQVQDITERKLLEETRLQKAREEAAKANRIVEGLRKELVQSARFHNMVSRSPQMKKVFDILPEMAQTSATVLITGESGTGKELIARSLHELGPRKNKPFVAINCSALPDNLLESELFGYKAGAFTDAKKDKPGKFALAQGGTLFLDEIGDISPAMQVKLLRVLQEKMYEPLGGTESVRADARIVAATNKDLQDMVRKGEFREDLYYRIKVLNISLPPLRERRCDIPLLCDHFVNVFNSRYRKEIRAISDTALTMILSHDFPGNIRELENVIEHAFIFCKADTVQVDHLPIEIRKIDEKQFVQKTVSGVKSFRDLERMYIEGILAETGGNKLRAAQRLGIHKATLFRKLKQLDIDVGESLPM